MNGRELRRYFAAFNERYFGNRLPPHSIRIVPRFAKSIWMEGHHDGSSRRIKIERGLTDEEAIGTLIHEMAHARLRNPTSGTSPTAEGGSGR